MHLNEKPGMKEPKRKYLNKDIRKTAFDKIIQKQERKKVIFYVNCSCCRSYPAVCDPDDGVLMACQESHAFVLAVCGHLSRRSLEDGSFEDFF